MRTKWVGNQIEIRGSWLMIIIDFWWVLMIVVFKGKVFGSKRSLPEWLSLFLSRRFGYWIGVICASIMVNRWTISFFIV